MLCSDYIHNITPLTLHTPSHSVELLSLKCCKVTDQFLTHFTHALTENRSLLHFDLSCNNITNEGVSMLASSLRLNRTLLTLTLTDNSVGDAGVAALCEVCLCVYDVWGCVMCDMCRCCVSFPSITRRW